MYTYGSGSPATYGSYNAAGSPGGYGADDSSGGSSWADIISATLVGATSIYGMTQQQKLAKQQQHAIERQQAALLTQQQQVIPGTAMAIRPSGFGTGRMLAIGGVLAAGAVALMMVRKRR